MLYQWFLSAWTSPANCSAIREDKRTAGQEEDKTQTQSQATEFRGGPEPGHRARPQSPATEFMGAAKRRTRGAQEEDKTWTQSRATEPSHRVQGRSQDKDKRRTRPGHRAGV